MASARSKDTAPELKVRSFLHSAGFRFKLHPRSLPGKPDIVLVKWKSVVFVHGCFWHQHMGCKRVRKPKTNQDYWLPKLQGNQERDRVSSRLLREQGWQVHIIWECEVKEEKLKDLVGAIKCRRS
ncbi:MAG TPA: very short patch repair endonuclease [Thermoanaerobaculia bacterium]|nr:very short patch repair endonuclease [Thermoanaerobaculia bacterium]